MIYLISYGGSRPNRITETKDEQYHARYARFCVFNANNALHQEYLRKIGINKQFYIGNQWIDEEDLEEFLKDDTGELRNRLKVTNNIIRPMVEQYRGNAIRMEYNARLKSFSKNAINRREEALAETMMYFKDSQDIPSLKPMLKRRFGVGDTAEETYQIFENTYVDEYIEVMNNLIIYVSELNEFEQLKFEAAIPLALNGICIAKHFEYAGQMRFQSVDPEYFFWDRTGKKYDLSDAGFWGETIPMEVTDILEQNPDLDSTSQQAIEGWSSNNVTSIQNVHSNAVHQMSTTKVPTFYVYWKDTERIEYGYVLDEFGYPYLTKINFTWPGEKKPRYTDKDLIMVDNVRQKKVLGGKLKKAIYVDLIRYCHFVPVEIVGSNSQVKNDIVLDYGVLEYQETNNIDFHSAKPPYCIYTWAYIDGQVVSPVDDIIDPQRMINRIMSVAENQINNSRGSGSIIDKSVFSTKGEQSEALRSMNMSRPVLVDAKGRGIQNMVGNYDGTVRQGTQILFNVIDTLANYGTRMSGVNEAMQGQQNSPEQLVGTTQLMIQHGSLMQEPFYNAISEMMRQCYQKICSVGKNIYADNERELAIAVGDKGGVVIKITRDFKAEDFRAFVKRENVDNILIAAANNMLLQYIQLGLVDDIRAADLINRATPDQVAKAVREYAKEKIEMRRQQVKNQNAMAEDMYNKMAVENQLAGAREEQNQLNNKQSQESAEKTQLQKTLIETGSKEKIAQMNNNRANLENK